MKITHVLTILISLLALATSIVALTKTGEGPVQALELKPQFVRSRLAVIDREGRTSLELADFGIGPLVIMRDSAGANRIWIQVFEGSARLVVFKDGGRKIIDLDRLADRFGEVPEDLTWEDKE